MFHKTQAFRWISILSGLFSLHGVYAADLVVGNPVLSGKGCVGQKFHSSFDTEKGTLSVTMDPLLIESKTSKFPARKSCSLSFPIEVSPGYQVAVETGDFSGHSFVSQGGFGSMSMETFLGSQRFQSSYMSFQEAFGAPFHFTQKDSSLSWSTCGGTHLFRADFLLLASPSVGGDPSLVVLENIAPFQVHMRKCQ